MTSEHEDQARYENIITGPKRIQKSSFMRKYVLQISKSVL